MELKVNEYGTRILTPSQGKQIALVSDINTVYEYKVYLGVNENINKYIEVDAPEPIETENDEINT